MTNIWSMVCSGGYAARRFRGCTDPVLQAIGSGGYVGLIATEGGARPEGGKVGTKAARIMRGGGGVREKGEFRGIGEEKVGEEVETAEDKMAIWRTRWTKKRD